MSDSNKKLVVILDALGRTIVGKDGGQTDTKLSLENPCIIHVQPNAQTNQLQLQLIPVFFKEFLNDFSTTTVWTYDKSTIAISNDLPFAPQFIGQYENMWKVAPLPSAEPQVVKLFDDE